MTFLDQRLDAKITRGAMGGPTIPGRIKVYTPSGDLYENRQATKPVHRYDVSHGLRSRADFQTVLDIWYIVMFGGSGGYTGFRFKDWRDYIATQTNSKLTVITGSTWQLQRKHVFGGVTFLRDIQKPVTGTVVVYRTRAAVISTATASIDYNTGIATITGHVGGDTYTWSGEFDVPVTFVDDEWTGSLEVHTENLHIQSGSIKLEEIRL